MLDGVTRKTTTEAETVSPLDTVSGLSLPSAGRSSGAGARAVKRTIDVTVASLALLLLTPVMLVLLLLIRLDSEGPAVFSQIRLGRNRRPFKIFKLRTMYLGSAVPNPYGPRSPLSHRPDPALITGIGGFLRRSGLDEVPQLVNVIKGEMSLVGPRPFVPLECAGLPPWAEQRFTVRPGITGVWQIRGQHSLSLEDLCRLDLQYANSWTLGSDLYVLALTPARLWRGSA